MKVLRAAVLAAVLAVGVTGCGSNDEPSPDNVEAAFDLTWDATTLEDKQNMCAGIHLFGIGWAANELGDDELDGDRLAVLMSAKCDEEGL